ncbi:MAG TPA: hypothetical protein HA254_02335 [Candidatus Diapherotrites archaeon]|uniref:Cytochrome oxidase subunit II copper A binding domain-containing protein n=1 Tax=Candidatus Iainarchaeum sp. TaxID=3101447 RepID=A0A7J4IYV9_9ARCH|nr:hypothetical protein [Candidatus Diapherotrites archaeon]
MKNRFSATILALLALSLLLAGCAQQQTDGNTNAVTTDNNQGNNPTDKVPGSIIKIPGDNENEGSGEGEGNSENNAPDDNSTPQGNDGNNSIDGDNASAVREFSMTAKKWEWEPGTITVNQGDRVRLNIKSVDVAHGILLPDFNVDVKFAAGESATAEFVATKKGAFTFRCNVFCGEGHSGMAGTLIVN